MIQCKNLLAHISGTANSTVSFSGVVISLNNNESSNIYFSANFLTLQITVHCTNVNL